MNTKLQRIALLLAMLLSIIQCGANFKLKNGVGHENLQEHLQQMKLKYSSRNITVHLLSHSHEDIGWLKTLDEYYSGTSTDIVRANVRMVISTVVDMLLKNPIRRFTYVEMKFFSMWWSEQTEEMKTKVRQLVQEGRLEFANAGWSMHDEACTHYEDMINNMKLGHDFLLKEFGVKPRTGWHVDPFGHSSANARLFAEMGFDGWFFARLDRQDKDLRYTEKTMEFIWKPFYLHLGNTTQIFTHALYDGYCYFPGYWYDDRFGGDSPVIIDPELETYNAEYKEDLLIGRIYELLQVYRGDHILIMMGCDFTFSNAQMNFISMDRLIEHFNSHYDNIQLQYSTPGIYLDALKQQNLTYSVKYDDMFPYSDGENDYWTGYFTSRANSKKQIRDGQANLHASNKIFALRVLDQTATDEEVNEILNASYVMLDAQGINQHHDAVTGTGKQHVADDYIYRIYKAIRTSNPVYAKQMNTLISNDSNIVSTQWTWCDRLNGTYLDCPINSSQHKDHIVVAHNPSAFDQQYIKLKVSHGNYYIQLWNASQQQFDNISQAVVICNYRIIESSKLINDCDLHIKTTIPASAFSILQIKYDLSSNLTVNPTTGDNHSISSLNETLTYSGSDEFGVRFNLTKNDTAKLYQIAFDLRYYLSYQGGGQDGDKSGAYIFRPDDNNQSSLQCATLQKIISYDGQFVQEIFMDFSNSDQSQSAQVKVRYYDTSAASEWEVYMQGIPQTENNATQGKEVTVNWKSFDIKNNNTFYTDSNGLEMQKRILNYQPTYNFSSFQKVAGNYYPVNSAIAIVDEEAKLQMTVMNDRSQGGSVVEEGRIELMQNRRLYFDDGKGVEEALNETDQYGNGISVPATYRLQFIERDKMISQQRNIQLFVDEPLQYFFTFNWTTAKIWNDYQHRSKVMASPSLSQAFKYALFPVGRNQIQVRLENIGDKFDTDHWNLTQNDTTITFPLEEFCDQLYIEVNPQGSLINLTIVETSLTGNQEISAMIASKTNWQVNSTSAIPEGRQVISQLSTDFKSIDLSQQRIRMFNVTFIPASQQEEVIFLS